jgi:hypothetical protein
VEVNHGSGRGASLLIIPVQPSPHQHQAPSEPATLIRERAVSRLVQRLRQPAIRRLEWAIWPIYVSKQAKKLLHPQVSAMGHEILQDSLDQVRMRFEIVILAMTIIPHPGVWMRSRQEPQKVVRSILNGSGHRFDLLGWWGRSNVRRNGLNCSIRRKPSFRSYGKLTARNYLNQFLAATTCAALYALSL